MASGVILCLLPVIIVLSIATFGLSIAEIVMGAIHREHCRAEYMIPIYLIVSGVFGVVFSGSSAKSSKQEDDDSGACQKVISGIVSAFTLAWFIAGNVFVFRTKDIYQANNATLSTYCNDDLYQFAYWSIIAKWILFSVVFVGVLCLHCCAKR